MKIRILYQEKCWKVVVDERTTLKRTIKENLQDHNGWYYDFGADSESNTEVLKMYKVGVF